MTRPTRSIPVLCCALIVASAGPIRGQDGVNFPPRLATDQDAKVLGSPDLADVKQELGRIGLHQAVGHTCRTFVTADSIRPAETPLTLDQTTVTLPYASFLIWSADRPYVDAVFYHIYAAADGPYRTSQPVPPGTAAVPQTSAVKLAPRERLPSETDIAGKRESFANGPFTRRERAGGMEQLEVKPYVFPTQSDDPASVLPAKDEHTLQVTCLTDPGRVTNCLCAGTD